VARQVLAADLALLADLEAQISAADERIAGLLPATEYAVLTTVPGWGSVRVAGYAAALGPLSRWPAAAKVYRAAGLTPTVYESAGRRRDGGISREGSVPLHHDVALIDETGRVLAATRISDDLAGFTRLCGLLAEHTSDEFTAVDVALETDRGLLVAALRAAGHRVYAVNPKAVDRYRDRYAVSGAKSDPRDALVLAHLLRTDAERCRPLPEDSEQPRRSGCLPGPIRTGCGPAPATSIGCGRCCGSSFPPR
jgi:transposase